MTPLQLATYVARVATGRAVEPHLTRRLGGEVQAGTRRRRIGRCCRSAERDLQLVRDGMWAVVNEPGGTAPLARLPDPTVAAGRQDRLGPGAPGVARAARARQLQLRRSCPGSIRPHALFVAYAPYDAPRYAVSVVVEHGNAGAAVAAPVARDIMIDTLQRDPANRTIRRRQVAEGRTPDRCRPAGRWRGSEGRMLGQRGPMRPRVHLGAAVRRTSRIGAAPAGAKVLGAGSCDDGPPLIRETSFGLAAKLWQINWLYVLLLCALAGVGYVALYSAAGGSPEPYAARHVHALRRRPGADARRSP